MDTTRAIVKKTLRSPLLLLCLFAYVTALAFSIYFFAPSPNLFGSLPIVLLVAIPVKLFYLQPDYAVRVAEWLHPSLVFRMPTGKPIAALTIDDVPLLSAPTQLEELLDVLKKHGVKATLLIMSGFTEPPEKGGMREEDRDRCLALLSRAVAEGHELGNHMMFDRPAIVMPAEEFDRDFMHCDALLAKLHGEAEWQARPHRWFRPASALCNARILETAKAQNYTTVITSCYPHDAAAVTRHVNAAYLTHRVRPGAVVVVHDRWHTVATLDKALPKIAKKGIQLVTLSELQAAKDAASKQEALPQCATKGIQPVTLPDLQAATEATSKQEV